MGLFNKKKQEIEIDGYIVDNESRMILHIPPGKKKYEFPIGTKGIAGSAVGELKINGATEVVIPESFENFRSNLNILEGVKFILSEGIKSSNCVTRGNINFELPGSIKKLGYRNYPITDTLILPDGIEEIEKLFASHDILLKQVVIPGSLKKISSGAFNQCRNLEKFEMKEGVMGGEYNFLSRTNGLRELAIPSTFNGNILLDMDSRPVSNNRTKDNIDMMPFDKACNQILTIEIKRGEKAFQFRVKRGDIAGLDIRQNHIKIYSSNSQEIIFNCEELDAGIYTISNGKYTFSPMQNIAPQHNIPSPEKSKVSQPAPATQSSNQTNKLGKSLNASQRKKLIYEVMTLFDSYQSNSSILFECLSLIQEIKQIIGCRFNTKQEIVFYINQLELTKNQFDSINELRKNPLFIESLGKKSVENTSELSKVLGGIRFSSTKYVSDGKDLILASKTDEDFEREYKTFSNKISELFDKGVINEDQLEKYDAQLTYIYRYYLQLSIDNQIVDDLPRKVY